MEDEEREGRPTVEAERQTKGAGGARRVTAKGLCG